MIEASGLRFVVEARRRPYLSGLRIEVNQAFGRDALVAYSTAWGGGAC